MNIEASMGRNGLLNVLEVLTLNLGPLLPRLVVASLMALLCTWAVFLILRHRSAALKHRVLLLGCCGCLSLLAWLPVTHRYTPVMHWTPVNSNQSQAISEQASAIHAPNTDNTERGLSDSLLSSVYNDSIPDDLGSETMRYEREEDFRHSTFAETAFESSEFTLFDPVEHSDESTSVSIPATEGLSEVWYLDLPFITWLCVFWIIGFTLCLIRLLFDRIRLFQLLSQAVSVTDTYSINTLRSIAIRSGISGVRLLCSHTIDVPVAVGILRPTIVLPVGFGRWTSERLEVVLAHELAHLRRADILAHLVARGTCSVYWFNPLVWFTASRMRVEREMACDDLVIDSGTEPSSYAAHLVEIASHARAGRRAVNMGMAMATPSCLRRRIARLLCTNVDRRHITDRSARTFLALALVASLGMALASPAIEDPTTSASPPLNSGPVTGAILENKEVVLEGDLPADWHERLLKNSQLQRLVIRSPAANFKASQLSQLKQIKEFHAKDFRLDSRLADIVLVQISKLPNLRSVTFERTGLTAHGIAALAETKVEQLRFLGEELLTDEAFESIGKMSSLRVLTLDATPVEARGLEHLNNSSIRSLSMLRHHSASTRLPVIAKFKQLEQLEIGATKFADLVVLKNAESLRELTLRDCGAFKAADSLSQLTQLKRLLLDNADLRDESLEELTEALAKQDIEVVDISPAASDLEHYANKQPNSATQLARKVHRDLDIAGRHPTFWMRYSSYSGRLESMQAEPIRTLHRLLNAIDSDSDKIAVPYDDQQSIMAWSPGQFFIMNKYVRNGIATSETYKYGDAELAWAREKYGPDKPVRHFPRNGAKAFEDSHFHIPQNLQVTHQSYWWGIGKHHNVATSSIPPKLATYTELPSEIFAGEPCRVLESAARGERLWISSESGLVRGVLTYMYQGFSTPFHRQRIVTQLAGREIRSRDEYQTLFDGGPNALSAEKQEILAAAWSEYKFQNAIPGRLYRLEDYRQIAPGSWLPFRVLWSGWLHNRANQNNYDYYGGQSDVLELQLGEDNLRKHWERLLPKEGEHVQDQRHAVAIDYTFRKDRTQQELDEMVTNQLFRFAESHMKFDAASDPFNKLIGKPAFGLPQSRWIGERPELTGERYLLHFWAAWCGPCKNDVPLLNSIAKNRVVIGVHPGDTPLKDVEAAAREAGMNYPTVVAAPKSKDLFGYPAKIFPYVIEVDGKGRVVKHGSLRSVLDLSSGAFNRPADSSTASSSEEQQVSGEILALQNQAFLAIFSLGKDDGIVKGQIADVHRDGVVIAQLKVVMVSADRSVGQVTRPKEFDALKAGDQVRLVPSTFTTP